MDYTEVQYKRNYTLVLGKSVYTKKQGNCEAVMEVETMIIPILQVREQMHREVK